MPVYRVGMNFVGMSHDFIGEKQESCVYKTPVAVPESAPDIPGEFTDKIEHKYNWRKSIEYCKAFGITEYQGYEGSKEADHALARKFQFDRFPDGRFRGSYGPLPIDDKSG